MTEPNFNNDSYAHRQNFTDKTLNEKKIKKTGGVKKEKLVNKIESSTNDSIVGDEYSPPPIGAKIL